MEIVGVVVALKAKAAAGAAPGRPLKVREMNMECGHKKERELAFD